MAARERPFRIVVVGAGVGGLVASKCLQQLGIDHVVLEKHREVAPPVGAGISMWPHAMRILHQLGYEEALTAASIPIRNFLCRDPTGRLIHDNALYELVEKNHGTGFFPFERQQFLQLLYDGLPDKSYIRTSARVEDIVQHRDGVEVKLSDGSIESGDMVLGCDGVHSSTRSIMWDHATRSSPGLIQVKEKTSLKTSWKTLVLTTPAIPELGERDLSVTYNHGFTFLATSQPHAVYFFVIFALDQPYTWPKRERYSEADAEALAELVADKPVTDQLVFADVWKRRQRSFVISLQEGVMDHWHHGRICLTGDAVHKVHPNLAFGGNSAIEGVVAVLNHVQRTLARPRGKQRPSGTALSAAFAAYEGEQRERMRGLMELSNLVARIHTYATPLHRLLATWVLPLRDDAVFANQVGEYIAAAPQANFCPPSTKYRGRLAWRRPDDSADAREARQKESQAKTQNWLHSLALRGAARQQPDAVCA
ncbi:FAD binding domain protein [Xylariomycetidae sp. FL0641]|nr:FAD binding domain protein [Xylariomycetidae sp. FL0641]